MHWSVAGSSLLRIRPSLRLECKDCADNRGGRGTNQDASEAVWSFLTLLMNRNEKEEGMVKQYMQLIDMCNYRKYYVVPSLAVDA